MSSSVEFTHLRETLNRRAKSLALLRPVFDLENNKGRHPELGLQSLDIFRLIAAVLDVIVTEMGGFQRGATYEQVLDAVTAQVRKVEDFVEPARADHITSFLVDALTNEKVRDAFRLQYQHEAPDGRLIWSPLVFKLVELRDLDGTGEGRYVASAEAINIYLNSLGVDLEGQQAADEAAVRHFIRHGKLDEAELAARTTLVRTIEYADRIRRTLQLIERGVGDFDWVAEMIPFLNAARNLIEERMKAQEDLVVEAERKMDEADLDGRRRLAAVVNQLDATSRQQNALLNLVLGANPRFMDEHARQRFRPATLNPFPNPLSAVLRPLLRLTLGEIDEWTQRQWFLLHPVRPRALPDYALMTRLLLRPRREVEPSGEVVVETELEEGRDPEPAFAEATWDAFQEAFTAMPDRFRLSECLNRLPKQDTQARQLAILRVGQWYEGHGDDPDVQPAGEKLACDGFYGDDLVVTKRA